MSDNLSNKNIAAVVITFNRKQLLLECVTALINQTLRPDCIIVYDNGSTDGSYEYLKSNGIFNDQAVLWKSFGENLGWSRAINIAMKELYQLGYNWIWLLDDDAIAENNTLEILFRNSSSQSCIYPAYVAPNSDVFSEPINLKIVDSYKTFWKLEESIADKEFEGLGAPFLGLIVPRNIIENIGFPREDTFIWGDYEYLERIRNAGFKVIYNLKSILRHPGHDWLFVKLPLRILKFGKESIWIEYPLLCDKIWKEYYGIRNQIFFTIISKNHSKKEKIRTIIFTVIDIMLKIYYGDRKFKRIYYLVKAFKDGVIGNMGKRVNPF